MKTRVGRLEWWGAFAVSYFLYLQATEFLARSILKNGEALSGASLGSVILVGVAQTMSLAVALAVQHHVSVRRAHDRDIRPIAFWAYAATSVVTFAIGFSISVLEVSLPFNSSWIWAPQFVAFGWAAIELGARPGDPIANRWGPVPKPLFDSVTAKADNYKPPRM